MSIAITTLACLLVYIFGIGQAQADTPAAVDSARMSNADRDAATGKLLFFYEIVLNGAMKDAGMAPFKAVLEQKDAAAIRAYLIKRANEDKGPSAKQ